VYINSIITILLEISIKKEIYPFSYIIPVPPDGY
jgi:hypothetical protein